MGEVKKSEKKVLDIFGIDKFPTLLVLTPGEEKQPLVYDGKLKYQPLYDHLSTYALASTNSQQTGKSGPKKEKSAPAPEPPVKPKGKRPLPNIKQQIGKKKGRSTHIFLNYF